MQNFKNFQLSNDEMNLITGGLSRRERRKLRKQLSSDSLNFTLTLFVDGNGEISEKRTALWKGYDGGIEQYYADNYTNGVHNGYVSSNGVTSV